MKLVMLMYLEEDEACVRRLLADERITSFSRVGMEGEGPGGRGWYGETAPYRSRMVFALVPEDRADALLSAVRGCTGISDPRHPIRAARLPVEEVVSCECRSD